MPVFFGRLGWRPSSDAATRRLSLRARFLETFLAEETADGGGSRVDRRRRSVGAGSVPRLRCASLPATLFPTIALNGLPLNRSNSDALKMC